MLMYVFLEPQVERSWEKTLERSRNINEADNETEENEDNHEQKTVP